MFFDNLTEQVKKQNTKTLEDTSEASAYVISNINIIKYYASNYGLKDRQELIIDRLRCDFKLIDEKAISNILNKNGIFSKSILFKVYIALSLIILYMIDSYCWKLISTGNRHEFYDGLTLLCLFNVFLIFIFIICYDFILSLKVKTFIVKSIGDK
jgi:hypothetical protein